MKILQASPLAGTFLEGLRSAEKCSEVKVCASSCVRGGTAFSWQTPGLLDSVPALGGPLAIL